MSTENVLFSKEYVNGGAGIIAKHSPVQLITAGTADEVDLAANGTPWQFGVAREALAIGGRGEIQISGIALCMADAAIVKGAKVVASGAGKVDTSAPGAGTAAHFLGIALETAAADGDIFRVLLAPGFHTVPV